MSSETAEAAHSETKKMALAENIKILNEAFASNCFRDKGDDVPTANTIRQMTAIAIRRLLLMSKGIGSLAETVMTFCEEAFSGHLT